MAFGNIKARVSPHENADHRPEAHRQDEGSGYARKRRGKVQEQRAGTRLLNNGRED
jgi:hypothetical protein